MNGIQIFEILVSLVVFWSIALAPPLLTRFLILKRPMGKAGIWVFIIIGWFVNWTAQYLTGALRHEIQGGPPPNPGDIGIFLMAWATYAILKYEEKKSETKVDEPVNQTTEKWTE